MSGALDANGALAVSGAHFIDQLTGVGFGVTILIISLAISLFGNYLQFRRNNEVVNHLVDLIPDATAAVAAAANELKEAYIEYLRKN